MKSQKIIPPKFLHDIHGSTTTLFDIILSYAGGLVAAGSVYLLYAQNQLDIPLWKLVLLLLISADIGAGVVANFTKGTNQYYSGSAKANSRFTFILMHFLHPAIFFFALSLFSYQTIGLVFYVIASALVINAIKTIEIQRVIASFASVLGISLLVVLNISNPFLIWFFALYMVKLFIAFGIRRYH